jgi:hypothetical protein
MVLRWTDYNGRRKNSFAVGEAREPEATQAGGAAEASSRNFAEETGAAVTLVSRGGLSRRCLSLRVL